MSGAFVVFAPTNTQLEIVVMAVVVHVHVNEKRRMVEEKKKREEGRVSGRRGKIRGGGKVKGWWGKIAEMAYLIYVLVCLPCVSNSFLLFLTIFLLLFFSSSRGGNCERERGREDENFAGSMEKKIESQRCERFIRYSYGCYTSKYVKYMRAIYREMCICMSYIVFALLFFFFFYSRFDLS